MGQRTERAVGRGVRVAADHAHAWQGCALLRANHVDDALARIIHLEFGDAVLVAVVVEGLHLQARHLILDGTNATLAFGRGRHVMVRRCDDRVDPPWLALCQPQTFERLRRGHFVDDMTVNVDQRRTVVALFDQM